MIIALDVVYINSRAVLYQILTANAINAAAFHKKTSFKRYSKRMV